MKMFATAQIKVKLSDGIKNLKAGDVIEILESKSEKARHYIEKGLLNPIDLNLSRGQVVEWNSPLFSKLSGPIADLMPDGLVQVDHPLTGQKAIIPCYLIAKVVNKEKWRRSAGQKIKGASLNIKKAPIPLIRFGALAWFGSL